jgi:RNA polymerase sigma-32 factor
MSREREDALNLYYPAVRAHAVLTAEEEVVLGRRWRDEADPKAYQRLVLCNMRAVIKIAGEFAGQHAAFSDLVQEGTLGLLKAVERFDPDRGTRFLSYAAWWIRAYIRDYLLRTRSLVRLGTTQRQRTVWSRLGKARAQADAEGLLGEARMARIVEVVGVDRATVEEMAGRLGGYDVSLDAPVHDDGDGAARSSFIEDGADDPEQSLASAETRTRDERRIHAALAGLPPREAEIIHSRHLADHRETLQEVGDRLGISRERVRQLEVRALRRMRMALETETKKVA